MSKSIIDPRIFAALANYYPSACAIQSNTPTRDSDGAPLDGWATVAGMSAIPCAVSSYRPAHEIRRETTLFALATHRIALAGHYPSIVPAWRAVIDGIDYDIIWVEQASLGSSTTLVARVLYPTG